MAMTWTKDQEKVITLRNRNILVSAAAGSGKTAVLVQRILSKITDPVHPVDIDRLLIMTFTRAAAGEMRERIADALEQALYEDPDNEHLQRQTTLIHGAQITTIDGFCAYVIRNYFHLIDLDPGYRTGDEGELKLLREDVLAELLEDAYASGEKEFLQFVECYAPGKSDEELKDWILKVYEGAMSHPYPEKWLEECVSVYKKKTPEEFRNQPWMQQVWQTAEEGLFQAESLVRESLKICEEECGPWHYEEALQKDFLFLRELEKTVKSREYDQMAALLSNPSFARLSAKKTPEVEPELKEQVKLLREEEKTILKEMGERYFPYKEEELLLQTEYCEGPIKTLVGLTKAFMERFAQKKREKNLLDFTDMEHFALKILMNTEEEGKVHLSQAARELSEKYEEVLVDEYQDSNLVQEMITNCVSGWVNQKKNIFMVGDVKQSIYRFRLARPELFMEKYRTYTKEESLEQRIDLHKNFRSRPQVLASVNYLFRQLMGEDLGGIVYDEAAALYPGAEFPKAQEAKDVNTEILMIEKDQDEEFLEELGENEREIEALAVAQRILELVKTGTVLDKETGGYRPVEYGDIAVLLRTASGWAETFGEVFASKGIPSYTTSRTGYFSAREVVTILNFLRVCDNPLQDIPLTGVLYSPIVGCTSQELGLVRDKEEKELLFLSVVRYHEENREAEDKERADLWKKLDGFLELLSKLRDLAAYTPVHQLIMVILEETGYGSYARAMPDGEQRSANLQMLVEKAMEYEKTSYRGLFNFIRYIESLQKYQVDFGEVNLSGNGQSSVQIMTIHKSKGLEFPIVFVSGMGKQFNFQDINARLLIHPEMGFGTDVILPGKRIIAASLQKQMIRKALLKESLGEELRVLYVALTRAKEKLIITGAVSGLEKQVREVFRYRNRQEALLPLSVRMKARTYWSFLLPALAAHPCMEALYDRFGLLYHKGGGGSWAGEEPVGFCLRVIGPTELTGEDILIQTETQIREETLKNWDASRVYEESVHKEIQKCFAFTYPYGYLKELPVKVSVSELKKRNHVPEEREDAVFMEADVIPWIPSFISKEEGHVTGAARGTAYHRVMECLDYSEAASKDEVKAQLQRMKESELLTQEEAACISPRAVVTFVQSDLGKRMKEAFLRKELFREQPFVISRSAREIDPDWPEEESVLVQGIIDAYFMEGEELILVDYKTDRIRPGEEEKLIQRYHTQLEDYQEALERMTGKKVKEKVIYSFALNEPVWLTE